MKNIQKVAFEKTKISVSKDNYGAGDGISISEDNKISVKIGNGLDFDENCALRINCEKETTMKELGVCNDNLLDIVCNRNGFVGLSKDKQLCYSADLKNWSQVSHALLDNIVHLTSFAGKFVIFKYVNIAEIGNRMYVYYSLNGTDWIDENIYYTDTFDFTHLKTFGTDFAQFWYVVRRDKHALHVSSNGLNFAPLKSVDESVLNDNQFITNVCFNADTFIFLDSAGNIAFLPKNIDANTKYNRFQIDFLKSLDIDLLKYGNGIYCFAHADQSATQSKVNFSKHLISGEGKNVSCVDLKDVGIVDLAYSKYSCKFYVLVKNSNFCKVYAFDSNDLSNYKVVLEVRKLGDSDTLKFFDGCDGKVALLHNFINNGSECAKIYLEECLF